MSNIRNLPNLKKKVANRQPRKINNRKTRKLMVITLFAQTTADKIEKKKKDINSGELKFNQTLYPGNSPKETALNSAHWLLQWLGVYSKEIKNKNIFPTSSATKKAPYKVS